jgi:hypothetical protein
MPLGVGSRYPQGSIIVVEELFGLVQVSLTGGLVTIGVIPCGLCLGVLAVQLRLNRAIRLRALGVGRATDLPWILWIRAWYQCFSGVATGYRAVEWRKPSTESIPMGVWCDFKGANQQGEEKSGAIYGLRTKGAGGRNQISAYVLHT